MTSDIIVCRGQGDNAVRSAAGSIIVWKCGLEVVKMKRLLLVKKVTYFFL